MSSPQEYEQSSEEEKEGAPLSEFFVPFGVVLVTALLIEMLVVYYSKKLGESERRAEIIYENYKRDKDESDSESSIHSAVGFETDDAFFKERVQ
nr:unnamed protein product [Haemonchus contortus]